MMELYCEVFDAYYENNGRAWLEEVCGNEDGLCRYCPGRPEIHPFDCECQDQIDKDLELLLSCMFK